VAVPQRIDVRDDMPQWIIVFPTVQFEARDEEEAYRTLADMFETDEIRQATILKEVL